MFENVNGMKIMCGLKCGVKASEAACQSRKTENFPPTSREHIKPFKPWHNMFCLAICKYTYMRCEVLD